MGDSSKPGENYITTNRFYVEMGGSIAASFTECSGISIQVDKEVYLEGGVNNQQRIFLKQTKFQDITLKRGMTDDVSFWQWMQKVLNLTASASPSESSVRRNLTILLFNQAGQTIQSWRIIGAIPVAWKTPTLQASGNGVAIEELTIAYEGLEIEHPQEAKPPVKEEKPNVKEKKPVVSSGAPKNANRDQHGYFL
jgi:phage tail-like protein